jgi:Domain of Unknown Function with PDB structure (DUF3857)/Transglutaminase-like superfamily
MPYRCLRTGLPFALILAFAAAAAAEDFPPVTAEERSLTAVAGEPNAPAVVLYRNGVFRMMGSLGNEASSLLTVSVRIKILTEAGRQHGDVKIAHSNRVRLQGFAGRTTLPDGTMVPLPKEVTFKRTASRSRRIYVTSVAFPAVQVGAILDYKFEMRWESPFYFDPWLFQDHLPVLHSEIVYEVPRSLQAASWRSNPMRVDIKSEATKTVTGTRVRVWADHLPTVPEEVHSLPFADMTARQLLLPGRISSGGRQLRLFDSWPSTCELFHDEYETARHRSGAAERQARALASRAATAAAAGTPPAPESAVRQASIAAAAPAPEAARPASPQHRQAASIFEFVRDEIATAEGDYVWLPRFSNVDAVLDSRRGTTSEKALLLQAMLDAVGIKSRLVWAVDRESGAIDVALPNPAWFDRVLVAADIDGGRVFLDANDRALAFGHLDPGYEGTNALLYDPKKPEMIVLPESRSGDNLQHARLDLALDAGGRASGHGTLELLGHAAFRRTRWHGDSGSATEAWSKWLRERFPGFDVAEVTASESLDPPRVLVSWTLQQHPEEALGDQATVVGSRPLGPRRQPFPHVVKRRTAVVFDYPESEELELTLHWAAGWRPEVVPPAMAYETAAGTVAAKAEIDAGNHSLVYRRRFDNAHRRATTGEQYAQVQALFDALQQTDAQTLVLARR